MMNDPLLVPTPPVSAGGHTSLPAAKRARRPGPATSAKILATGLATTAMLGLTTGYALAKNAQSSELSPPLNAGGSSTGVNTTSDSNTSHTATPPIAAPTPEVATPFVTSSPVIEVPVPDSAPAQPGNNWNSGDNQPSSGSN